VLGPASDLTIGYSALQFGQWNDGPPVAMIRPHTHRAHYISRHAIVANIIQGYGRCFPQERTFVLMIHSSPGARCRGFSIYDDLTQNSDERQACSPMMACPGLAIVANTAPKRQQTGSMSSRPFAEGVPVALSARSGLA
jgi:hypothetical protein